MRYLVVLLFLGFIFSACSGSKEIQMGQLNQEECKDRTTLTDSREFTGETIENLTVYQQGENVYASMDVRTNCTARITFTPKQDNNKIILTLRNANAGASDCVCNAKVTTSFTAGKGDYLVRIMNSNGDMLLGEQTVTVQ